MAIGRFSIKPTKHYQIDHSDVEWDLVVMTILSPTSVRQNKRYGKDRFTYIKRFKESVIEVYTKRDFVEDVIWVINAFKIGR